MRLDIASILNRAIQRQAPPSNRPRAEAAAFSAGATVASPATRVVLSEETSAASDSAKKNASEMRDLLSKLDFHSITPKQMAQLGTELFSRRELTDVEATAFVGVANSFAVSQPSDKPVDVVAHFEKLLNDEHRYQSENGTDNGVRFRQAGVDALRNVISFVSSDRLHISD